uniref:Uncharacterized protein n=1 Tax=Rhizophora mucronata TaxID=61149 RepID=A0A2P2P495_RHIMU
MSVPLFSFLFFLLFLLSILITVKKLSLQRCLKV